MVKKQHSESKLKRNLIGGGLFMFGMIIGTLTMQPTLSKLEKEKNEYYSLYQNMLMQTSQSLQAGYGTVYLKNYCTVLDNYFSLVDDYDKLMVGLSGYTKDTSWLSSAGRKDMLETKKTWNGEYTTWDCGNR